MRVEFEFTQKDWVDAQRRFLARSRVARSWLWNDLIWSAILSWGLVFLVFRVFFSSPLKGAAIGFLAALLIAVTYPTLRRGIIDKRLGKFFEERLGDQNSFTCEVEITPAGYWTKAMDIEGTHQWTSVEEITNTEDAVSIFARGTGGVIVRSRAFTSPAQQQEFFYLAARYFDAARVAMNTE